jgi:predicted nuclease with TOPRIM domain
MSERTCAGHAFSEAELRLGCPLCAAEERIAELEGEVALMNEKLDVWQAKWHEAVDKADELGGR